MIVFDAILWLEILKGKNKNAEIYFLNVGQGDSELIVLPGNIKILIDGGPDNKVLSELSNELSSLDRYIDLVILSHPEQDHFGGLVGVLKNYKVGAFIYNGINRQNLSFQQLEKTVHENKISMIALGQGDNITYLNDKLEFLWPAKDYLNDKQLNDTVLVTRFSTVDGKALFVGDIGENIESELVKKYDLKADVLKVGHHGSKYSSAESFLKNVSPEISVIEVGKNSYGHPAPAVLERLASVGSQIFRTDKNGDVEIVFGPQKLNILTQK